MCVIVLFIRSFVLCLLFTHFSCLLCIRSLFEGSFRFHKKESVLQPLRLALRFCVPHTRFCVPHTRLAYSESILCLAVIRLVIPPYPFPPPCDHSFIPTLSPSPQPHTEPLFLLSFQSSSPPPSPVSQRTCTLWAAVAVLCGRAVHDGGERACFFFCQVRFGRCRFGLGVS
jgi:hypothetical protein